MKFVWHSRSKELAVVVVVEAVPASEFFKRALWWPRRTPVLVHEAVAITVLGILHRLLLTLAALVVLQATAAHYTIVVLLLALTTQ